jgi:hypothetical protein
MCGRGSSRLRGRAGAKFDFAKRQLEANQSAERSHDAHMTLFYHGLRLRPVICGMRLIE